MATPKREKKVRDAEATKRALLDAVGEILRQQGFSSLTTNVIARWIGKDKNLIRYHFNGLANLQKLYIKEKDYWPRFFEKFQLEDSADEATIRKMFIELMKENFNFFEGSQEMQKIILWQISEDNPLMRSISESRENEGERLLSLTDRSFIGTEISFRAVISLILGGTYYIILHSKTNKSKVCGIDINHERDKTILLRTIENIIYWAWQQARENKQHQSTPMINYEFELLETIVDQLTINDLNGEANKEADPMLKNEVKRLERVMQEHLLQLTSETQIKTHLQINLNKLIKLSNHLYNREREFNPDAVILLELVDTVRKAVTDLVPGDIRLPDLFKDIQTSKFSSVASTIKTLAQAHRLDPILINIVLHPFERFCRLNSRMRWRDFLYLRKYSSVLEIFLKQNSISEDEVIDTLIGLGYNHVRVAVFYASGIKLKLQDLQKRERRIILIRERTRLSQVSALTSKIFDIDKPILQDELSKWIDAELDGLAELDTPEETNQHKFNSRLKVLQLAFWHKLQNDHEIFNESNLDALSDKIAHNFSTKGQEDLSATSIKSKFYAKDRAVLKWAEATLIAMLDDVKQFL